ncbi:hypothetical protein MSAN_01112500 [Mycena sanguinolenta]|uniref:Uncharacterized protein n=1 Tax=Mycena sanguinolenta TaxID=230812 RepID=A0A8H6YLJ0_9AGAR|nr:hypothetical protein MSAN_01112500 [Mycena sanguinolenta]
MPVPIVINSSGLRARLLFYSMPAELRPTMADHPSLCPHGQVRFFDIDMATLRFGDIYTWFYCSSCASVAPDSDGLKVVRYLTNLADEQRTRIGEILTFWDMYFSGAQRVWMLSILENTVGTADSAAPREITVYLYLKRYKSAIIRKLAVMDRSQFTFRNFFDFTDTRGYPDPDHEPYGFGEAYQAAVLERYQLSEDAFTRDSGVSETIDISSLGSTLIYREVLRATAYSSSEWTSKRNTTVAILTPQMSWTRCSRFSKAHMTMRMTMSRNVSLDPFVPFIPSKFVTPTRRK